MLKQDYNTHDGAAAKNAARTPKHSAPRKTPSRPKKAPKPDDITKAIESLAENRPRSFANTPMNSKNAALFAGLAQGEHHSEKIPARRGRRSGPALNAAPRQEHAQENRKQDAPRFEHHHRSQSGGHAKKPSVKIIPLGGLGEIGKNLTAYECGGDIFMVDCGLAFPDADMLGVDLVIPDFTYLLENKQKIRGVVITHGHEDHIGAIPYLLKHINPPIYGTKLSIGLIEGKLKEHGLLGGANLNVIKPRQTVKMGCMAVEFIRVNHSIPDCVAMGIHTPAGIIIQTGDFKVDYSPIEGETIDLARLAELGNRGVLALLSDSTNAERPGYTMSESKIGQSFDTLFNKAGGKRIIIATFASNIHRIQQIINSAVKYGRRVAVSGRSMVNVVAKATELGYLKIPSGTMVELDSINRYPNEQMVLITTGSQGEPLSALARMASEDHRKINVTENDFIIISATPIPGNEKHVTAVINSLLKLGAEVITEGIYEVHVSGHACQEEQKLIMKLTQPKFFLPVHGEYKHLMAHRQSALSVGIPEDHIHIGQNGEVIELTPDSMKVTGTVTAGAVFVDGLGVGDVGSIVLRDRQRLAEDGLIVVVATINSKTGQLAAGPDIVSRGFVYVRESEELMERARKVVRQALLDCLSSKTRDWSSMKLSVRDSLSGFLYRQTQRSPMILPVLMEI